MVYNFSQYSTKRPVDKWFWSNSFKRYPKLFNQGYGHFQRVIRKHNSLYPLDTWPVWSYSQWLPAARWHASQRRSVVAPKRTSFDSKFYNYVIHRFGAWPSFKNPRYMAQFKNSPSKPVFVDIKALKQQYFNERLRVAAERARKKTKK